MGRLRALRSVKAYYQTLLGPRFLDSFITKRRFGFLAGSIWDGQIEISAWLFRATDSGIISEHEGGILAGRLNEHCTARLFQRLRTTDANQIWSDITPAATHLYSMLHRQTTMGPGTVARVPTRSGHLVVPYFEVLPESVTFNTDSRTGPDRLREIVNCRQKGTIFFEADRGRTAGGTTGGTDLEEPI